MSDVSRMSFKKKFRIICVAIFQFFAMILSIAGLKLEYEWILRLKNALPDFRNDFNDINSIVKYILGIKFFYVCLYFCLTLFLLPIFAYALLLILYWVIRAKNFLFSYNANKKIPIDFDVINVHCHLLNFKYTPDTFVMARFYKALPFPLPLSEWIARFPPCLDLLGKMVYILSVFNINEKRMVEWIDIWELDVVENEDSPKDPISLSVEDIRFWPEFIDELKKTVNGGSEAIPKFGEYIRSKEFIKSYIIGNAISINDKKEIINDINDFLKQVNKQGKRTSFIDYYSKYIVKMPDKKISTVIFDFIVSVLLIFHVDRIKTKTVSEQLISEMDKAGISLACPLMMDLGREAFSKGPDLPYRAQVDEISEAAIKYPGRFLPFVMFDPRREDSFDIVEKALKKKGFIGVKMYPALGFDPNPESEDNTKSTNENLVKFYDYCKKIEIPIITHCSKGGALSEFYTGREDIANRFGSPENWHKVLQKYEYLKINFAHLGGRLLKDKDNKWREDIASLILNPKYPNLFTDLACDTEVVEKSKKYFERLKKILELYPGLEDRILFGTDWPMARRAYTESEYIKPFANSNYLEKELFKKIAFDNPLKFLCGTKCGEIQDKSEIYDKLPKRIRDFYEHNEITWNGKICVEAKDKEKTESQTESSVSIEK